MKTLTMKITKCISRPPHPPIPMLSGVCRSTLFAKMSVFITSSKITHATHSTLELGGAGGRKINVELCNVSVFIAHPGSNTEIGGGE